MCNLSKMCNICGSVLLKDSDSQVPLIDKARGGIPSESEANGYVDELNEEPQPEAENTVNPEAEGEEQTEEGEEIEAAEGEEEASAEEGEEGEEGMSAEGEPEYEPTAEAEGIEFSSLFFCTVSSAERNMAED